MAGSIDRDKKTAMVAGGARVPYDQLVIAPGIDLKWDSVPGYSEAAAQIMPHAWKPGAQTELLVKKLNALKDGDLIVMVAPPNPFRCPPGPYERVSMFAHVLKKKGHKKSKIIIVDPKPAFGGSMPVRNFEPSPDGKWIAFASRFCVFWMRNTIRKVTMVVPVLITSCQVSL